MPSIGIGGLLLDWPHSGTAVYTRNLLRWLPEVAPDLQFRVYTRHATVRDSRLSAHRLTTPLRRFNRGPGVGARLDKLAWETVSFPVAGLAFGDSLLHNCYFATPPLAPCPTVLTIHDLGTLVLPGYHRTRQSVIYSRFMAWAARRASAVITVSEHAREEILRVLRVPENRVVVTPEAADERFNPVAEPGEAERLAERYGLPERYVLYLGGAERRKNIEILVRAWSRIAGVMRSRGVRLAIVASFPPPDPLYPDIPALARELNLTDDLVFVPTVTDSDVPALFRTALAFCFPSVYEGFGLPPLEALASGTPCLVANTTSLPEVVGDAACLLAPDNVGAWADAILRLIDSPSERRDLSERGVARAARFSWRHTAQQTADIYRSLLP